MKEFWRVEIKDKKYVGERIEEYFVFATSAKMAEEKALKFARKDRPDCKHLYCRSTQLMGYVAG